MKESIGTIIDSLRKYKRIVVPAGEALFFAAIIVLSYWLRLETVTKTYIPQLVFLVMTIVPVKIMLFWLFRLYHISFRYTSIRDILVVIKAATLSALVFALFSLLLRDNSVLKGFPRSIILIDFLLTTIVSSGIRITFRMFYFPKLNERNRRRTLIVGAGSAGEQLVKEMQTSTLSMNLPVAFVDDDPDKRNMIIHGVKVEGGRDMIPEIIEDFNIDEIIIAMPSVSSGELRLIMDCVRGTKIKDVKILPSLLHVLSGQARMGDIRQIAVEDLLGRKAVTTELEGIASYLRDKRVLVTGAAGSIGSELCRQIASFGPMNLILVDIGETELFYIDRELEESSPQTARRVIIADIKDVTSMRGIFLAHSPQVVFHAAAYKHVPLMETNLREAVLNNIGGTKNLADLAIRSGVEKFIFISTDKAINPTSIMGTTKRVSENLLRCLHNEKCRFISVRFGNVLESRGSVVPIFKEQIRNGKPITITHPEMKRYLMSITEAVQLVLQAGMMGKGGEVFVLDMGEPIKIVDLAKEMIRLSGLEPDRDIPIIFTGIRPGEKLFEELLTAEEGTTATRHEKIFVAKDTKSPDAAYIEKVDSLLRKAQECTDRSGIISLLKDLVPTYKPGALSEKSPDSPPLISENTS